MGLYGKIYGPGEKIYSFGLIIYGLRGKYTVDGSKHTAISGKYTVQSRTYTVSDFSKKYRLKIYDLTGVILLGQFYVSS